MKTTVITDEEIFKTNLIRKPYYAIQELTLIDNELRAVIPVEQPLGSEAGPITFAESARHLAILGSCVINMAKSDGDVSYLYAALEGHQKRCSRTVLALGDHNKLYGFASGEMIDKRRARAKTRLIIADSGELLYEAEVIFYLIPEKIFTKKYVKLKQNTEINLDFNPYQQIFPLEDLVIGKQELSFSLGKIKPEYCAGHFPNYPILPVAILGYYQSKAMSLLLDQIMGVSDSKYLISHAVLLAHDFAFAGTKLIFSAKLISHVDGEYSFESKVIDDSEKNVATATATLLSL